METLKTVLGYILAAFVYAICIASTAFHVAGFCYFYIIPPLGLQHWLPIAVVYFLFIFPVVYMVVCILNHLKSMLD